MCVSVCVCVYGVRYYVGCLVTPFGRCTTPSSRSLHTPFPPPCRFALRPLDHQSRCDLSGGDGRALASLRKLPVQGLAALLCRVASTTTRPARCETDPNANIYRRQDGKEWSIDVAVGEEAVVVTHTKRERAHHPDADHAFTFKWELTLTFPRPSVRVLFFLRGSHPWFTRSVMGRGIIGGANTSDLELVYLYAGLLPPSPPPPPHHHRK